EVLERGSTHVGVFSGAGAGRDPHWLPLQGKSKKIEDVLPDEVHLAAATELLLDECQDAGKGLQKFGMFVGEGQQRAPATQPNLKAECLECREKAVPRDRRGTELERKRQPAADHVRRGGIE